MQSFTNTWKSENSFTSWSEIIWAESQSSDHATICIVKNLIPDVIAETLHDRDFLRQPQASSLLLAPSVCGEGQV